MKIAVAGTGYVGLSIATLLSQHHEVMAVDIIPEKVDLINQKKSPNRFSTYREHFVNLVKWIHSDNINSNIVSVTRK